MLKPSNKTNRKRIISDSVISSEITNKNLVINNNTINFDKPDIDKTLRDIACDIIKMSNKSCHNKNKAEQTIFSTSRKSIPSNKHSVIYKNNSTINPTIVNNFFISSPNASINNNTQNKCNLLIFHKSNSKFNIPSLSNNIYKSQMFMRNKKIEKIEKNNKSYKIDGISHNNFAQETKTNNNKGKIGLKLNKRVKLVLKKENILNNKMIKKNLKKNINSNVRKDSTLKTILSSGKNIASYNITKISEPKLSNDIFYDKSIVNEINNMSKFISLFSPRKNSIELFNNIFKKKSVKHLAFDFSKNLYIKFNIMI